MANKYPGPCYRCGDIVEVGEGVFEKVTAISRKKWPKLPLAIKWQTQHHDCAIAWRGTTQHYKYNDLRTSDDAH